MEIKTLPRHGIGAVIALALLGACGKTGLDVSLPDGDPALVRADRTIQTADGEIALQDPNFGIKKLNVKNDSSNRVKIYGINFKTDAAAGETSIGSYSDTDFYPDEGQSPGYITIINSGTTQNLLELTASNVRGLYLGGFTLADKETSIRFKIEVIGVTLKDDGTDDKAVSGTVSATAR